MLCGAFEEEAEEDLLHISKYIYNCTLYTKGTDKDTRKNNTIKKKREKKENNNHFLNSECSSYHSRSSSSTYGRA